MKAGTADERSSSMTQPIVRAVRRVASPEVQGGMNATHRVRLLLEPENWAEYDPFLLLAEDWFVAGTFGDHPHRGFETVTFVLEGSVEHRDNHGGHGVLQPGDAQWMTAGRGVVHSEEAGPQGAHTLQLWINLPARLKMVEPRYLDLRGAEMSLREERGARVRVFSGRSGGVSASTDTSTPITMAELELDAGATITQELPASYNAFLYVIAGDGRFGSQRTAASAGQVVWFDRAETDAESTIAIEAGANLRAILWGGEPLREPVAARGPFVMNTRTELVQAFQDFQSGRF
jgi:redox-sensitive bicupin YhaK (pirin superfamily)